jgi:general secretion pathway protein J
MLGLNQGVRFSLSAWTMQARTVAARDELAATERLLRRLIERAEPAEEDTPPSLRGLPGALVFRTILPLIVTGQPVRAAEVALGVDEAGRLVLRAQTNPRAIRLSAEPPPIEEVLLTGLRGLQIAYWRAPTRTDTGGWQGTWTARALPSLIRFRLVFQPGDARHWPDIVVAPVREPLREAGAN